LELTILSTLAGKGLKKSEQNISNIEGKAEIPDDFATQL
jgi:hypothetical protein